MGFAALDPSYDWGIITGLAAEARIARHLGVTRTAGATPAGSVSASKRLIIDGARALLSFGLAGGLDPALRSGMLVIPRKVLAAGEQFTPDPAMIDVLGGPTIELALGGTEIVPDADAKRCLWEQTDASAVDLESGAVARVAREHGLPFAVLRAVCDPAERNLPPAALLALDRRGSIRLLTMLASVAAKPSQIPELMALARDAAAARRALIRRVAEIRQRLAGM